ncbi:hypothetical protein IAQ61_008143 [Plenodomus lingam]|uniref:uncharacterized protein n=1 Tax=Leptosphaeria maculans TaxID=5022 RepID=UPI003322879B|nr:hypothetical protein IAQ61_008143 [Plenodomus lingam]
MFLTRLPRAPTTQTVRKFSSIASRRQVTIPYTQTCPSPTCECAAMPPDLDIDRKSPLLNTMAAYAEHVVICTGKEDWASNIAQEEGETGDFVNGIKGIIGKGGVAFDPFTNILLTASSLPKSNPQNTTTALLFPSFQKLKNMPNSQPALSNFASAYLKPTSLHPFHTALTPAQKQNLTRNPACASTLPKPDPITTPTILICGHASRDSRCGTLGPILQSAFRTHLARRSWTADVALISHIGGHKYAGNEG